MEKKDERALNLFMAEILNASIFIDSKVLPKALRFTEDKSSTRVVTLHNVIIGWNKFVSSLNKKKPKRKKRK